MINNFSINMKKLIWKKNKKLITIFQLLTNYVFYARYQNQSFVEMRKSIFRFLHEVIIVAIRIFVLHSLFYLRKRYFTRALHDIANIANVREKCSAKFDATLIAKEREKNKKPGIPRYLRNFSKFRLRFLL